MLRSIELFTGAGGLALGTHNAGFRHSVLVEWDPDACKTIRTNARSRALPGIARWNVLEADVKDVNFEEFGPVELVAGGPPCQPFSIGGKHRGRDDSRNLIPDFARAIRTLQPKAFIFENVKGLLRPAFETYFAYVVLELTYPEVQRRSKETWREHHNRLEKTHTSGRYNGLAYNVIFRMLNAADYGVPQTRHRVFVVGFRADTNLEWNFPDATHSLQALLWEQWVTGGYWSRHGIRKPKTRPSWFDERMENRIHGELPLLRSWVTLRDAIADLPEPKEHQDTPGVMNHRHNPGARSYVGHTGSPLDLPSKTLKAGVHGVPGGENTIAFEDGSVRYLTVREAARVQTFPDSWRLEGAWSEAMRQIGNAVPVGLAEVVAKSVAAKLKSGDGRV